MNARMERHIRWGALAVGILLFFGTLYYINFRLAFGTIRRLGIALPLALVFSGLWHLARTWAWAWCFPQPRTVSFARLARVRLAAEAFSYLTLRGIAGEPLKVVLLGDTVDARQATAAVALERVAYLIGTTIIVGVGSILAIVWLPVQGVWFRVFRGFAIAAGIIAFLTGMVITGRGTYLQSWLAGLDRLLGTALAGGRVGTFVAAVERLMLELVRGNPRRLAVLLAATSAAYACMALEAWVILRASGTSITLNGALGVETFSRVASFASAFIPANLGALEASSLAAVAAVGAVGGGAALALARRLRGLFWAGDRPRDLSAPHEHVARPHRNAPAGRPAAALHIALSAVRRGGQRAAVDATGRAPARGARPPSRAARRLHATDCLAASRRHTEPGRHAGGGSAADAENRGRRNHDCRDRATMARRALGPGARNAGDGHRRRHDRLDGAPRGRAGSDG